MAVFRDTVIVIKSHEIGETDKIVTLLGKRYGKFSAVAKGVRKLTSRTRGHLQTYTVCRVSCAEGRNLAILLEADAECIIDPVMLTLEMHERLGFASKVVDKIIPSGVCDRTVFDWWVELIQGTVSEEDVISFVVRLLRSQGFLDSDQMRAFTKKLPDRYRKLQLYVEKILETI